MSRVGDSRVSLRRGLSNAVVIAVAMLILLIGFTSYTYIGLQNVNYAKKIAEELREEGEKGSELLRIYIWSRNHTLEGEPVISILNVWGKDSQIDVILIANRTGHVVKVIALSPLITIPASTIVEFKPSDLGLHYTTFQEFAENIGGIMVHTVAGNSFGSTWGMPREENVYGIIQSTSITNITTSVWVIPSYTIQEGTTISEYMTLTYPSEWDVPAFIIVYNHFQGLTGDCAGYRNPYYCNTISCYGGCCYKLCQKKAWIFGEEEPAAGINFDSDTSTTVNKPRFSWMLVKNPLLAYKYWAQLKNEDDSWCSYEKQWECTQEYVLKNVTLSKISQDKVVVYKADYRAILTGTLRFPEQQQEYPPQQQGYTVTFSSFLSPIGYTTTTTGFVLIFTPSWVTEVAQPVTTARYNIIEYTIITTLQTYALTTLPYGITIGSQTIIPKITETTTVTTTLTSQPAKVIKTITTTTGTRTTTITTTQETFPYTIIVVGKATTRTTTQYEKGTYIAPVTISGKYTAIGSTIITYTPISTTSAPVPGSEYEAGHTVGTYGQVPYLYFKLVYPIYIIHRYYQASVCGCTSFQPSKPTGSEDDGGRGGGDGVPPKCNIVVKQVSTPKEMTVTEYGVPKTITYHEVKKVIEIICGSK